MGVFDVMVKKVILSGLRWMIPVLKRITMSKLILDSVFTEDQIEALLKNESLFDNFILKLKNMVPFTERWPVHFTVNEMSYGFVEKGDFDREIASLITQYQSRRISAIWE